METLIEVVGLKKYYPITGGVFKKKIADVKAVDGISLSILKRECFGLVGESGCGKTTFGKTVIRLLKPNVGNIFFDVPSDVREEIKRLENSNNSNSSRLKKLRKQYDLSTFKGRRLKKLRRRMQIVYQDPSTSLNPRMLVKDLVGEPLKVQGLAKGRELRERVVEMLEKLGLAENQLYRYPHEFSGGQRQRIAIAGAIITQPTFVVLDEPTSSLDALAEAELFRHFRRAIKGRSAVLISHRFSTVQMADYIYVMDHGRVKEHGTHRELLERNGLYARLYTAQAAPYQEG